MLLAVWWLLRAQGALWRRWIWDQAGAGIEDAALALNADVRTRWTGFRIENDDVRITWAGGLRGVRTTIVDGGGRRVLPGLVVGEALSA